MEGYGWPPKEGGEGEIIRRGKGSGVWCMCLYVHICSPKVAISHRTMPNDHLKTIRQ